MRLTYHQAQRWYKEHVGEASKIIQSSYLIEKTPLGYKAGKVDMKRAYMKEDIGYLIILLSSVMGLLASGHLNIWMVHFIETIRKMKMPIDWALILSNNLDD